MARHPSESRKDSRDQFPSDRGSSMERDKYSGECKGLCVNCAKRETCPLLKSEGGVWHCEEYVEDR